MSNGTENKGMYAFLAYGPLGLLLVSFIPIVISLIEDPNSPDPPPLAIVGILMLLASILFNLVALIMYIIHMARNRSIEDGARIGWIVGMVLGFFFCANLVPSVIAIVYFHTQIANPKAPITPNHQSRGNEWDTKLNS